MQPYPTARRPIAAALALPLALAACAHLARDAERSAEPAAPPPAAAAPTPSSPTPDMVADRLVLGRAIGDSALVSDDDWSAFVREIVTPRLRGGLTVWRAEAQWLDERGAIVREPVMVIELLHAPDAALEGTLDAIAESYRRRFHQESVLRVTSPARLRTYDGRRIVAGVAEGAARP